MIDLHLGARVACMDGDGGTVSAVIVHRATRRITHLVVKEAGFAGPERLVPIERATGVDEGLVRLSCTRADLSEMESFTAPEMVENEYGQMEPAALYWMEQVPDSTPVTMLEVEQVPAGGVAVRRGMPVEATDGPVGSIDDLLIDSATNQITHFSVREGHFRQRELTLPLAAVARVAAGTIHLTLARSAVAALPVVPARGIFGRGANTRAVPTEMALFAFPAAESAANALRDIQSLEGASGQAVTAGVVLVKDPDGTIRVPASAAKAARSAPLLAAFADGLSGRTSSPLMAEFGPMDEQLQAMRGAIAPGGSALLVVVDARNWTAALEEVARFHGTPVRQALLEAIVARLAGDVGTPPQA